MMRFPFRASLSVASGLVLISAIACSAGSSTDGTGSGDGDSAGTGDGDGGGDGDNGTSNPGDGDLNVNLGGDGDGDEGPRETECTTDPVTGEEVCTCISLATWGALGSFGAVPGADGQDAIVSWLNTNSTGEAEYFATKPAITAEFLANFDVIILQNLVGWAFTPEELAAIQGWVEAGGGIISLAGYGDMTSNDGFTESNQVLAFSGMQYAGLSGPGDVHGQALPECGYCLGNSSVQSGWTTHPIGANVTSVGALWGRSISPGTAEIVSQEPDGTVTGAAASVGEGRVFMFHDEWVTYNSQWDGSGLMQDCRTSGNATCEAYHPTETFQIPQFWFNSIKWASGDVECFEIDDVTIVR